MSAHVLLNLSNELGNRDKMRGLPLQAELVFTLFRKGLSVLILRVNMAIFI